jgi:hypothetical protein
VLSVCSSSSSKSLLMGAACSVGQGGVKPRLLACKGVCGPVVAVLQLLTASNSGTIQLYKLVSTCCVARSAIRAVGKSKLQTSWHVLARSPVLFCYRAVSCCAVWWQVDQLPSGLPPPDW